MLGDLLAERPPLLRVDQRQLQRPLGDPDATGCDVDATELQRVHHLRKPFVQPYRLAAENTVGRSAVAVEHQLGRLHPLVPHLADLRRDVKPLVSAGVVRHARLLLADKAGHPAVARLRGRVGPHQREHQRRAQPVGNPHLLAIDLIVALVGLPGAGLDRLHIGAKLRLGQAERGTDLARRHPRQIALLLLPRTELHQQVGADEVRVDDP